MAAWLGSAAPILVADTTKGAVNAVNGAGAMGADKGTSSALSLGPTSAGRFIPFAAPSPAPQRVVFVLCTRSDELMDLFLPFLQLPPPPGLTVVPKLFVNAVAAPAEGQARAERAKTISSPGVPLTEPVDGKAETFSDPEGVVPEFRASGGGALPRSHGKADFDDILRKEAVWR